MGLLIQAAMGTHVSTRFTIYENKDETTEERMGKSQNDPTLPKCKHSAKYESEIKPNRTELSF